MPELGNHTEFQNFSESQYCRIRSSLGPLSTWLFGGSPSTVMQFLTWNARNERTLLIQNQNLEVKDLPAYRDVTVHPASRRGQR